MGKSDISVKAITEAIHEYMYEKLSESPETGEEKNSACGEKKINIIKNKPNETQNQRPDCSKRAAPDWAKQHECPARGKKCVKCRKLRHYAKCCRSKQQINHIAYEKKYSADEDDWTLEKIHSIQQNIDSMGVKNKNGPPYYTKTLLITDQ